MVNHPPDESVRSVVAVELREDGLWKRLASRLKVKEAILVSINEEERGNEECCRAALKKWYESNVSPPTTRKVMICLTDMGYGNVNWHIMKELNLVAEADMPQS